MNIQQPLDARWFRLLVLQHAIRKTDQLRTELVALGIGVFSGSAVDGDIELHGFGMLVGLLDSQRAPGSYHLIHRGICRSEAARERGQALLRKSHGGARHLIDLPKTLFTVISRVTKDLERFGAKQVARRIDAIDAN